MEPEKNEKHIEHVAQENIEDILSEISDEELLLSTAATIDFAV